MVESNPIFDAQHYSPGQAFLSMETYKGVQFMPLILCSPSDLDQLRHSALEYGTYSATSCQCPHNSQLPLDVTVDQPHSSQQNVNTPWRLSCASSLSP